MNTSFSKNASSKILALWFICAALILFVAFSPADEAATRANSKSASAELKDHVIPSLFPEKLITLNLVDHLSKMRMRKLQKELAARHLGEIDNYFAQKAYIRWEEKMANHQIATQVSELQSKSATLKMVDVVHFVAQKVIFPKYDFPANPITEEDFYPIIAAAAKQHNVDPSIVKAIIMAESSYNPKAVSNKGARGLMQLMPKTALELGVKNSFDPVQNIYGGVRYFKMLLNRYKGNVKLALAAYNAGSGKVQAYNGIPPYKATRIYIKRVLKYQKYYTRQAKNSTGAKADKSEG